MNIQYDTNKHCQSCAITLQKNSHHKQIEFESYLLVLGEITGCEVCKISYFITDWEDHLDSEGLIDTEQEQQTEVKIKCNV